MNYYNSIRNRFGLEIGSCERNGHTEYQFICPFCLDVVGTPDLSGHLFVRSDNGVYHCYRCDSKGVINAPKNPISATNSELLKLVTDYLKEPSESRLEDTNPVKKFQYQIPTKRLVDNSVALEYMRNRGFSDEDLEYYDLRVGSVMDEYLGRVIIPNEVYRNNWTDMFTARSYVGHERRYKNPSGSESGLAVFNLFRIPMNSDRIIITEGPITAMAAGRDAVAMYGKLNNPMKLRMILDKNPKSIVVNFDPDAEHVAVDTAKTLKMINPDCIIKLLINPIEFKDAADYMKVGRITEYHELVNESQPFDDIIYKSYPGVYRK